MANCTHVTFNADSPNDAQWDESGVLLVPSGEGITSVIRASLVDNNIQCSNILQRSFYGWEFDFCIDSMNFFCVLQAYESGQWLLICELRNCGWRDIFFSKRGDTMSTGLNLIHQVLSLDSRFSNIRWHCREQFEKGGSIGSKTPT